MTEAALNIAVVKLTHLWSEGFVFCLAHTEHRFTLHIAVFLKKTSLFFEKT